MKNIALILGYGIFHSDDLKYKAYLDKVSLILEDKNFDSVIFGGGKTNSQLDISEAESMADYIKSHNNTPKSEILLEDFSFTTYENILFAKEKIGDIQNTSVNIICDSIRVPKVICYALRELKNYSQEEVMMSLSKDMVGIDILEDFNIQLGGINFSGIAMERTKKELADQIVGSIIQTNYSDHPNLNKEFVNYRGEQWGFGKDYFENRYK